MNQIKNNSFTSSADFQHATGAIPYNMTNDYMFRAVLQKNNKVLKGLICALLHLNETEVISVTIMNPIILGDALEDKESGNAGSKQTELAEPFYQLSLSHL